MSHLLRHKASVDTVSSEEPPRLVASYNPGVLRIYFGSVSHREERLNIYFMRRKSLSLEKGPKKILRFRGRGFLSYFFFYKLLARNNGNAIKSKHVKAIHDQRNKYFYIFLSLEIKR